MLFQSIPNYVHHCVSLNDSRNCSIVNPYTAMAAAPTSMRAAAARLRKILIPVDDSNDSEAALEWAMLNLYNNNTDELHFLHVLPYCAADFYSVCGVPPVDYVPMAPSEQQGKASVAAAEKWLFKRFVLGHLPADLQPRPIVHIIKVVLSIRALLGSSERAAALTYPVMTCLHNHNHHLPSSLLSRCRRRRAGGHQQAAHWGAGVQQGQGAGRLCGGDVLAQQGPAAGAVPGLGDHPLPAPLRRVPPGGGAARVAAAAAAAGCSGLLPLVMGR
jgi:hypothetical protein